MGLCLLPVSSSYGSCLYADPDGIAGLRPGEKKEAIDAAQNEDSASPRSSGVIMVSITVPAMEQGLVPKLWIHNA